MRTTLVGLVVTCSVPLCALSNESRAQCVGSTTLTLLDAYESSPRPTVGGVQAAGSAWQFRYTSETGPLMVGLSQVGVPTWGHPTSSFHVPLLGPLCSPDPLIDEFPSGRVPTFNGVFAHPGFVPTQDNVIVFSPQNGGTVSALQLQSELLGGASDGINIGARLVRAGGASLTLIPTQFVAQTATSATFNAAPGLFPIVLAPGDRIVITSNQFNQPFEDWQNLDVRITYSGLPVIVSPPRDQTQCAPTTADFEVVARGDGTLTYRWHRDGVPLSDGVAPTGATFSGSFTPHLAIANPTGADRGLYTCAVTSPCGTTISAGGYLSACQCIDFNNDSLYPDTADIDDFLNVFSGGPCPTGNCNDIDFNDDGLFPDTADIDAFLSVFSGGLCF